MTIRTNVTSTTTYTGNPTGQDEVDLRGYEAGDPQPSVSGNVTYSFNQVFQQILRSLIGVIALVIWAALGFLFWVPILARVSVLYSTFLTASVFGPVSTKRAEGALHHGIVFYVDGFRRIISTIFWGNKRGGSGTDENVFLVLLRVLVYAVVEGAFALVFWAFTLRMFGFVDFSVAEMLGSLPPLPTPAGPGDPS